MLFVFQAHEIHSANGTELFFFVSDVCDCCCRATCSTAPVNEGGSCSARAASEPRLLLSLLTGILLGFSSPSWFTFPPAAPLPPGPARRPRTAWLQPQGPWAARVPALPRRGRWAQARRAALTRTCCGGGGPRASRTPRARRRPAAQPSAHPPLPPRSPPARRARASRRRQVGIRRPAVRSGSGGAGLAGEARRAARAPSALLKHLLPTAFPPTSSAIPTRCSQPMTNVWIAGLSLDFSSLSPFTLSYLKSLICEGSKQLPLCRADNRPGNSGFLRPAPAWYSCSLRTQRHPTRALDSLPSALPNSFLFLFFSLTNSTTFQAKNLSLSYFIFFSTPTSNLFFFLQCF